MKRNSSAHGTTAHHIINSLWLVCTTGW